MAEKPTTAPIIEWVVETGQPLLVAIISQVPAAKSADIMPKTSKSGVMTSISTMPFLMVSVT